MKCCLSQDYIFKNNNIFIYCTLLWHLVHFSFFLPSVLVVVLTDQSDETFQTVMLSYARLHSSICGQVMSCLASGEANSKHT